MELWELLLVVVRIQRRAILPSFGQPAGLLLCLHLVLDLHLDDKKLVPQTELLVVPDRVLTDLIELVRCELAAFDLPVDYVVLYELLESSIEVQFLDDLLETTEFRGPFLMPCTTVLRMSLPLKLSLSSRC